jgi:hypothetical protein
MENIKPVPEKKSFPNKSVSVTRLSSTGKDMAATLATATLATATLATATLATATFVTEIELEHLGLTRYSRNPSGLRIVVPVTELEYITVSRMGKELIGKFAVAPEGYYWKHFSEKCYYTFEWYELYPIPV